MKRHVLWLTGLMWLATVGSPAPEARQAPSSPRTTSPRTKIDVSKLGPQVGERVPDFSLKDQNGTTRTLPSIMGPNGRRRASRPSIMGPKGAMLVFVRSADW